MALPCPILLSELREVKRGLRGKPQRRVGNLRSPLASFAARLRREFLRQQAYQTPVLVRRKDGDLLE